MANRYKHGPAEGEYILIFPDGSQTASWNARNKPGFYKEMIDSGVEIEPWETDAERAAREAAEATQALQAQRDTCISALDDSEIHVSADPPYPDDQPLWLSYRAELRKILKSGIIQKIPPAPF